MKGQSQLVGFWFIAFLVPCGVLANNPRAYINRGVTAAETALKWAAMPGRGDQLRYPRILGSLWRNLAKVSPGPVFMRIPSNYADVLAVMMPRCFYRI